MFVYRLVVERTCWGKKMRESSGWAKNKHNPEHTYAHNHTHTHTQYSLQFISCSSFLLFFFPSRTTWQRTWIPHLYLWNAVLLPFLPTLLKKRMYILVLFSCNILTLYRELSVHCCWRYSFFLLLLLLFPFGHRNKADSRTFLRSLRSVWFLTVQGVQKTTFRIHQYFV